MLAPMADEVAGGDAAGSRFVLVVVAAVVVLAVLVAVTLVVNPGTSSNAPRDRFAEAHATASAWLRAWERDDRKALKGLVEKPDADLASALDAIAALHPSSIRATAGAPVVDGATAHVPFDADVTLPAFGVWHYSGAIPLADVDVKVAPDVAKTEREWRVPFTPSVLHPDLQPGETLALHVSWPKRGVLEADDGTPLPAGHPMASILGSTGRASAAQAKALGPPYEAGDVVGQSGLQAGFEKLLAGSPAADLQLVRDKQVVKVEASFAAKPGVSVRTTLNLAVIAAAEGALGNEGNGAAMVVIKPSTGGILAVVNRPLNGYSRGLVGRYPPGSTFKVITTMALLQKGVTPDTPVTCPKDITVNGRTIANAENEELGNITLRDAFAHSCNTAYIQLAQRLTADDLMNAANALGFNADPSLGTTASTSQYPTPRGLVDLVSSAIGQGRDLVTPLQMASVAASVAAGGYRKPHFVELPGAVVDFRPLPAGTASTLQSLMRLVVSVGTGVKAQVPGAPVAGKTGTAEFGTVPPLHTDAWFISYRNDLASAIVVEDSGLGGDFAAPIAADLYRRVG